MLDVFQLADQLYKLDSNTGQFCRVNDWKNDRISTDCGYKPQKADFLAYLKNDPEDGKSEHSMILWKDWNFNKTRQMIVDGPWPVKRINALDARTVVLIS